MVLHLNHFLEILQTELPEICADKDLVEHLPNIFKSLPTIHRMRQRGQVPAYFSISPNYYYLKNDVLAWLRERYKNEKTTSRSEQKKPSKPTKQHAGARR